MKESSSHTLLPFSDWKAAGDSGCVPGPATAFGLATAVGTCRGDRAGGTGFLHAPCCSEASETQLQCTWPSLPA